MTLLMNMRKKSWNYGKRLSVEKLLKKYNVKNRKNMILAVKDVDYLGDYTLLCTFNDGVKKKVDLHLF